jgi:hypothetical protein
MNVLIGALCLSIGSGTVFTTQAKRLPTIKLETKVSVRPSVAPRGRVQIDLSFINSMSKALCLPRPLWLKDDKHPAETFYLYDSDGEKIPFLGGKVGMTGPQTDYVVVRPRASLDVTKHLDIMYRFPPKADTYHFRILVFAAYCADFDNGLSSEPITEIYKLRELHGRQFMQRMEEFNAGKGALLDSGEVYFFYNGAGDGQ